jgi:hypothetical protein
MQKARRPIAASQWRPKFSPSSKGFQNQERFVKSMNKGFAVFLAVAFSLVCAGQTSAQQALNQFVQRGDQHVIPGCGVSGCYATYEICVTVPPGANPISIAHYYDSFSGWGEFINPRQTATGFCANYQQHSHNVTRIVSFDVLYQANNAQVVSLSPTEADM